MQIKRKMRDPAISLLIVYPKEMQTYFHQYLLEMFRATLFIITQTRNYPNVHNTSKSFKTVAYLHNLILHNDENEQLTANQINIDESYESKAE